MYNLIGSGALTAHDVSKVLPSIGFARPGFAAVLLPGIVALTVVTTALQGVTLPLVLDLGFAREIDDRLLAPLPVSLVAVEINGYGLPTLALGWVILGLSVTVVVFFILGLRIFRSRVVN